MKKVFFILGIILIFSISWGEIYKWVDEKGTVHFTEDPSTIPEEYRGKAKSRITEEDIMTPEERMEKKKREEKEAVIRRERDRIEYERLIAEEERKRKEKQMDEAAEEEKIRKEKEEKARGKESEKELIQTREPSKPRLVKCRNCMGGYIKCSLCDGKGGKYIRVTQAQTIYSKCGLCDGTGKKECPICGGKGVLLKYD